MSEDRLEALKAKKAKREEDRAALLAKLELEALELEDKYETEGKRLGVDFAIATTAIGNFAVRKPDFVVAKGFADAETNGTEEVIRFVAPCVLYPDRAAALSAFQEHAGVAFKLATLLMRMYEAQLEAKRGK